MPASICVRGDELNVYSEIMSLISSYLNFELNVAWLEEW